MAKLESNILGHLSGARALIDHAGLDSQRFQGESSRLLDWVEYHMVMSRFSHRHWYINGESAGGVRNLAPEDLETCHSQKVGLENTPKLIRTRSFI
jgi:hypothetical protein